MNRVYLDWNATAPLRPEARAAMLAAMDVVGNPSSVHAEGRAAKAIVEKARWQVAQATGAENSDVVFTSSATETAALVLNGRGYFSDEAEHDCVLVWTERGQATPQNTAQQQVNGETGAVTVLLDNIGFCDAVQAIGKIPYGFEQSHALRGAISSHKFGGPKGAGALLLRKGIEIAAQLKGGGQEQGRRSGTENVVGIAGMGAAAEAAQLDLDNGVWDQVGELRNSFEDRILNDASDVIIFGKDVARLPNTSYFAVPGWKGETQVMQMDLAGYAVSAGSACSSGKTKTSRVLKAMGFDDLTASSALRVSIGPTTTKQELDGFATAWLTEYRRFKARAA